ncbi:MAG: RNase adapter RapZ, partial [Nitrospira sp.]
VVEGVRFERERLSELRKHADQVIDTSSITVHELRDLLIRQFRQDTAVRRMTISLVTFGYKFGVPYDIDLLFDVRFIRNPFFVPELKALTGEDARVQQYVFGDPTAGQFLEHLEGLFAFLIPLYERDQRSYLSIGIGCTGGRHRSVTMALRLRERFAALGYDVSIAHRDLQKS